MRQPLLFELSFCICCMQIFILYSMIVFFLSGSSVIADRVTESYILLKISMWPTKYLLLNAYDI